jgi:hypothetical protein
MSRTYGTEKMRRAMGRYTREHRFTHPTPETLLGVFKEELGEDAEAMARTAFFGRGWIDHAIIGINCKKEMAPGGLFDRAGKRETVATGASKEHGNAGWVLVARRGTLRLPVDVELQFEDGTKSRQHLAPEPDVQRLYVAGSSPLRFVVLDPDHKNLLDDDLGNNARACSEAKNAGAARTLEQLTFVAGALFGALKP